MTHTWKIPLKTASVKLKGNRQLIVRGEPLLKELGLYQEQAHINITNRTTGQIIGSILSICEHREPHRTIEHPTNADVILEACVDCHVVRAYNVHGQVVTTIHTGNPFKRVCIGPDDSVLAADTEGTIFKLIWRDQSQDLSCRSLLETKHWSIWAMSYDKKLGVLAIITHRPIGIEGVMLNDGLPLWRISGEIQDQRIRPSGVCWDNEGRVYITDISRVLVVNGKTGEVSQIMSEPFLSSKGTEQKSKGKQQCIRDTFQPILDICFSPLESELVMLHGNVATGLTISCFLTGDGSS